MSPRTFERFGGLCAILAGLTGLLYAVAFVIVSRRAPVLGGTLSALFLTLLGLFSTAALAALFDRTREAARGFAVWGFVLAIAGAIGSTAHGGYDLANAIHPPEAVLDLPNAVDPRGLLTFGFTGLGILVLAGLSSRAGFSDAFRYLGYLLGLLLIVIYLARLILLDPANPILLVPVLVSGFVVNPLWYLWLGVSLWRGPMERMKAEG